MGKYRTGQDSIGQDRTAGYSIVQYSTVQDRIGQHWTVQCQKNLYARAVASSIFGDGWRRSSRPPPETRPRRAEAYADSDSARWDSMARTRPRGRGVGEGRGRGRARGWSAGQGVPGFGDSEIRRKTQTRFVRNLQTVVVVEHALLPSCRQFDDTGCSQVPWSGSQLSPSFTPHCIHTHTHTEFRSELFIS